MEVLCYLNDEDEVVVVVVNDDGDGMVF